MVAPGAELGDRELSTHPRTGAHHSTPPGNKARPLGLAPGNSMSENRARRLLRQRLGPVRALYRALSIASALETSTWPGCASTLSDLTMPLSTSIA